MSRTDKTAPVRVQREDGRGHYFDPGHTDQGGTWAGIKELRRLYNRRDRRKSEASLRKGEQPEPVQPRGRAKWDFY